MRAKKVKAPENRDVIVVGGGDNGLLAAAYLAQAGAKTILVERHTKLDSAGSLRTEEYQGPYRFDLLPPHAVVMGGRAPCHTDLPLARQGLAYITPAVQVAFHHKGGQALVLHQDPDRSAAAIAKFSAADARRFQAMYAEFRQLCEEILIPSLYAADGDTVAAGSTELGKRLATLAAQSPAAIVDSYGYENPAVREAMLYLATFWGLDPAQAGVGQLAVLWVYSLLNSSMIKSGNTVAARALYQSFLESGGEYPNDVRVESILVEGKKAVGVRLDDGREIRAKAVVSTLNPEETYLDLVGKGHISSKVSKAAEGWEWQETSLLTSHFGYRGNPPAYRAAAFDPDVNEAYLHVFGVEEAGDVQRIFKAIGDGDIPSGHGRAVCTTQVDELRAGFGQVDGPLHTLRFDVPAPARLRNRDWDQAIDACRHTALEIWRFYAKDVVDAPLSYSRVMTPKGFERTLPSARQGSFLGGEYTKERLGYGGDRPACSQYRSEIPGLYVGGASTHGGGLVHFAAGYNAAGLVARDLKLAKLWSEPAMVQAARKKGYLPQAK